MKVICGLGNPGLKYTNTRHNIGFDFIDKLIIKYNFKIFKKDKYKKIYNGSINNNKLYLFKPLTYVNLSGPVLANFLNFHKIASKDLTVIHDDLDLTFGKIKVKVGGGNGGHNGLTSIDKSLGKTYKRIRIGIGHPGSKELVNKYVLSKPRSEEKKIIDTVIKHSTENIHLLFSNKDLFLTKIASLRK